MKLQLTAALGAVAGFMVLLSVAVVKGVDIEGDPAILRSMLVLLRIDQSHVGDPRWRDVGTVLMAILIAVWAWLLVDGVRRRISRRRGSGEARGEDVSS